VPLTPLVGRQREVDSALHVLREGSRLVTLTGPAGVGKTRMSIALATATAELYPDGVRFISLAPIVDPELMIGLVAAALNVTDRSATNLVSAIASAVGGKRLLLVLDNFEHVPEAAQVIPDLLAACAGLAIVATSRTPLHLSAEHLLPIPTLSVPDPQHAHAVADLYGYEAIQLFISRASAACGEFALTTANASSVIDICNKLNGLPLAIELATARLRILPPNALVERLQPGLPLLSSSARDVPARMRSMRDAVAWSFDLLSPTDQTLFRRLGVFAGGFSIEAVERVCMDGIVEIDALGGLSALLDHSLLRRSEHADLAPRFDMLHVVREFALEQLCAAGEDDAIRRAHAAYFRDLAHQAGEARGAEQERLHALVAADMHNIRAVLAWALRSDSGAEDLDGALELCGALWFYWIHYTTSASEARLWLTRALDLAPDSQSLARARALLGLGAIEWRQGDYAPARAHLDLSTAIFAQLDDVKGLGDALHLAGHVLFEAHEYDGAQLCFERSLAAHTRAGDPVGGVPLIGDIGMLAYHQGDYPTARRQFEACLRSCRQHGVRDHAADSLNRLGDLARLEGDLDSAKRLYTESLALWRSLQGSPGIASGLHKLGQTARRRGDVAEARRLLLESLSLQRDIGNKQGVIECVLAFGGLALESADAAAGAELLGAAEAALEELGAPLAPADYAEFQHDRARATGNSGAGAWAAAYARGRRQSIASAVLLAESLAAHPAIEADSAQFRAEHAEGGLSPREMEVAALLAKGLSNRQVATALTISEKTAANHLEHIMTKLDLRSRAQVAVWAVKHGFPSDA
jgi:non-specific serine/threonine protein kinase